MKLQSSCPVCLKEFITNQMIGASESTLPMITNLSSVGFREDGRYEMTCLKGHSSITFLQQQKFEILFDIGAHAIIDAYYREAVSSFTSLPLPPGNSAFTSLSYIPGAANYSSRKRLPNGKMSWPLKMPA